MLNVMRENLRHLKWVLWAVAISLTLYLGSYFFDRGPRGRGGDWAARVDGTSISRLAFLQAARNTDRNYRELLGDQYETFKPQLQIGRQVIQTLIDQQIILAEADKLGLAASPEEISREIIEDPTFQGPDGKFVGKERYKEFVTRRVRGGVAEYERSVADRLVIRKWRELVTAPVHVTDDELERVYRQRNERTEIDYVVVSSSEQDIDLEVSEAEAARWYEAHPDRYRRPEGRRIHYALVKRQDVLEDVEIGDEEIETFYEENRTRFARPEQRRARHILFRVPANAAEEEREAARERAEDALARLEAGESFEELARNLSDDQASAERGGDLGFFGRGTMAAEFEEAVFSTSVGELAPVTRTSFGFHVIEILEERPSGVPPLSELREDIGRQLRQQRAEEQVASRATALAEEADSAEDLTREAAERGLEVVERVVTRDDLLQEIGPGPGFMEEVFRAEVGSVSPPLRVREGRAVLAVEAKVEPSVPPLEEILDRVKSDVLNERTRTAARESARRALERHGDLAAAANALGLEVTSSGPLTRGRSLPRTGGTSPELEKALFGPDSEEGARGAAPVPAGAVLYEITARERFDPREFASQKDTLRGELANRRELELMDAVLTKLRERYAIEVNQPLVDQVNA